MSIEQISTVLAGRFAGVTEAAFNELLRDEGHLIAAELKASGLGLDDAHQTYIGEHDAFNACDAVAVAEPVFKNGTLVKFKATQVKNVVATTNKHLSYMATLGWRSDRSKKNAYAVLSSTVSSGKTDIKFYAADNDDDLMKIIVDKRLYTKELCISNVTYADFYRVRAEQFRVLQNPYNYLLKFDFDDRFGHECGGTIVDVEAMFDRYNAS